jgi:competence protein ComEC
MSEFDYRLSVTRFVAKIKPIAKNGIFYRPIESFVRINGEFNLSKGDNIKCVGWINTNDQMPIKHTVYVPSFKVQPKQLKRRNKPNSFKKTTRQRLLNGLNEKQSLLAGAIFFGIRTSGWHDLYENFRRAGMSHILAISGLHVSIVVLVVVWFSKKIKTGKAVSLVLVTTVLLIIMIVIDPRAPAIRAVITALIVSLSCLSRFRCKIIGLIGASSIIMLVENPVLAAEAGFQLSFIVVVSLCVLLPSIKWRLIGPPRPNSSCRIMATHWFCSLWITGLCAWLVSAPIIMHLFGTVSPSGLLSSVPGVLVLTATLALGITRIVFGWWIIDTPIQECFSVSIDCLQWLANLFGDMPCSHIPGLNIGWYWVLLFLVWVSWWSLSVRNRKLVWISFVVLALLFITRFCYKSNSLTITTLDVGHGTCHIIKHKNYNMLVDGGSRNNLDVGANTIVPKLLDLGIRYLDEIIITHSDLDHVAGIVDVINTFAVKKILIAPQTIQHKTKPLQLIIDLAKTKNIPIKEATKPKIIKRGKMTMYIVSPEKKETFRSPNAMSVVLLIEIYGRRVLLTGDIDEKKIREIDSNITKHIDVIELPHHGQWSNESHLLVSSREPLVAIQSTNTSRHSKDRWSVPRKTTRLVTATDGTISITILENGNMIVSQTKHPDIMDECYVSKQY